jgi:hypothetical protein
MQAGRPIRIPRAAAPEAPTPVPGSTEGVPGTASGRGGNSTYRPNPGGFARALRIYLLYLLALVVLYSFFLELDFRSTAAGTSINESGILGFTLVALALAGVGAWMTLGQAPRGARIGTREIVVTERWGRQVTFPPADEIKIRLVRRHAPGVLSPYPTATVFVVTQAGARRTYVIDEQMLPGDPTTWLV